ncbi:MAG TPA: VOC family protein [Albitalea sp.]|uniref:VOC family protein n=1 Tax=Piscinibacter sp. TaxID=1903157 RepID=UPI002ED2AD9F
MTHLAGKFVWFEHVSGHVAKARKFYEPLFDWHVESLPMGSSRYPMILNGKDGIGGFRSTAASERPYWLAYVSVDDVDATYQAALAAGARAIEAPVDFPTVGRGATIADPSGAVFALWKSLEGDRADAEQTATGDWYWNELWTADEIGALAFYQRVFGYSHESMQMGAQGTYYLLKKDSVSRAGMMRSTQPQAPSMWLPYVAVADCDSTAAAAQRLGGQVLSPPADIPGVGRFAVLADNVGAAIAVIRPAPAELAAAESAITEATAA